MPQRIQLSGMNNIRLLDELRLSLMQGKPRVIGIAAAFVSTEGVRQTYEILQQCGDPQCRLIAGTDQAVTHPAALSAAREWGWQVRFGNSPGGIFHPKLVVAGRRISRNGVIQQLSSVYVGSSNLTNRGLNLNVECGLIADAEDCPESAAQVFAELWRGGIVATKATLRNYGAQFAELSRRRTVSELVGIGVSDIRAIPEEPTDLRVYREPHQPAFGTELAIAAWTGLQSFTGEYRFQVEFPKLSGIVIRRLVHSQVQADGRIDVYCPDDKITRPIQYRFYEDNGMFRLNIPNNVSGVAWARKNKDGLAIVEKGLPGSAPLRIRILKPGAETYEIVGRSAALGTWGKTSTRIYGWW